MRDTHYVNSREMVIRGLELGDWAVLSHVTVVLLYSPLVLLVYVLVRLDERIWLDWRMQGIKTVVQLKMLKTFGTFRPVKIPDCPVCLLPMLPPLKIFSCKRGHVICEKCKPRVVANTCVVCRSPGGQAVRALAVENLINEIVG